MYYNERVYGGMEFGTWLARGVWVLRAIQERKLAGSDGLRSTTQFLTNYAMEQSDELDLCMSFTALSNSIAILPWFLESSAHAVPLYYLYPTVPASSQKKLTACLCP
eukprot:1159615-Pelagomonas_calceolata.AAC.1